MFLLDNNALKLGVAGDENTIRKMNENLGSVLISSDPAEEMNWFPLFRRPAD